MSSYHPIVFLIKVGLSLALNQTGDLVQANIIAYQQLVGKLIYLSYRIQPDIAFVIG